MIIVRHARAVWSGGALWWPVRLSGWAIALALATIPLDAAAQQCERPACRADERFVSRTRADGSTYGVCQSEPNLLGHVSHRIIGCPAGFTLNARTGRCVDDGCRSGCGQTRPACPYETVFTGQGTGRDGPYASCESRSGPGFISHQLVRCRDGWSLIDGGMCRKDCAAVSGPIISPTQPEVLRRADLVITGAYVRSKASATPLKRIAHGTPYLVCVTVANEGNDGTAAFRVEGGGLGVPSAPFHDISTLAAGGSAERCLAYATTPAPGTYTLQVTADSRNAVLERREDNNTRRLTITVYR